MRPFVIALVCVAPLAACPKPAPPPRAEMPGTPQEKGDPRFQERVLAEIPWTQRPSYSQVPDSWGKPYELYLCSFSPDGTRAAYMVKEGERLVLRVNGQPVASPPEEQPYIPKFGPTGRLSYQAQRRDGPGLLSIVVDGVRGPLLQEYRPLDTPNATLFAAGGRYAYHGQVEGAWFLFVDGKRFESSGELESVVFSGDGSRIAWVDRSGDVFVEGENTARIHRSDRPVFSHDGKRLAYRKSSLEDLPDSIVVDGRSGKAYYTVGPPVFSPRGDRLADAAVPETRKWIVVADGKESEAWQKVAAVSFSPDGRLAYAGQAGDGTWWWVVEGAERWKLPGRPDHVAFAADGSHIAYETELPGNVWVFHDAVRIGVGRWPVLDPTGKHVAYRIWSGGQYGILLDGKSVGLFLAVSRPVFSPDARSSRSGPANRGRFSGRS